MSRIDEIKERVEQTSQFKKISPIEKQDSLQLKQILKINDDMEWMLQRIERLTKALEAIIEFPKGPICPVEDFYITLKGIAREALSEE